jgi:hypothetical protein
VPAQGELTLEVSCPILLKRDKTLAFLIFRHSEGLGNYVEGAFILQKSKGAWAIDDEFIMGFE